MWNNVLISLEIMGKGMAGIFIAIIIIMLAVQMIAVLTGAGKKHKEGTKE